jgi:hypothetical protein
MTQAVQTQHHGDSAIRIHVPHVSILFRVFRTMHCMPATMAIRAF